MKTYREGKKINLNKHTNAVILFRYGTNQLQGNILSLSTKEECVFVNDQLTHTLNYSFYVAQTHCQSANVINTGEGRVFIFLFYKCILISLGSDQAIFIHTEQNLTAIHGI